MTKSTTCSECNHRNETTITQLYAELQVHPTNSDFKEYVEESFNEDSQVGHNYQMQNMVNDIAKTFRRDS